MEITSTRGVAGTFPLLVATNETPKADAFTMDAVQPGVRTEYVASVREAGQEEGDVVKGTGGNPAGSNNTR
jgi:hypothetical protein